MIEKSNRNGMFYLSPNGEIEVLENNMKTIIMIQHTQSIHHINGMVGSWTDWNLSEFGKIQAGNIGKKLSEELRDKNFLMYSPDLARARQTAFRLY